MKPVKETPPVLPPPPLRKRPVPRAAVESRPPARKPRDWRDRAGMALTALLAWCSANKPLAVSACVHLVVFATLGLIVFGSQTPRPTLGVETFFSEADGPLAEFANAGEHPALTIEAEQAGHRSPLEEGMAGPSIAPIDIGGIAAGEGHGKGDEGDGLGGGGDIDVGVGGFFGTSAEGTSFVYIVDSSGSMTEQNRWGRALRELTRSVGKLKPHQSFYIYFFSDANATKALFDPRPAADLVKATPANKSRAIRWFKNPKIISPGGLTNPEMALESALAMKPQVIFLLTDGEFDDPDVLMARLTRWNQHGTVIHTIGLQNEGAATTLEAIAAQNKGTYKFVK